MAGSSARPGPTPALAAVLSVALIVIPWGEREAIVYEVAAGLLGIGLVLWVITWLVNRGGRARKTGFRDIEHLEDRDSAVPSPGPRVRGVLGPDVG